MKIAVIVVRVLMGLMFLFASVSFFLNLFPPPPMEGAVKTFSEGIAAAIYLVPTLKFFELICAISLLSNRFTPLATVILFPITLNIFLYHGFVATEGLAVAVPLFIGNLFLAWHYRSYYAPMLKAK